MLLQRSAIAIATFAAAATAQVEWQFIGSTNDVDTLVDSVGKDGLLVAGFFIHSDHYKSTLPKTDEQEADELFKQFRKMSENQDWLEPLGLGDKTWPFAYSHDKAVAKAAGCNDIGTYEWDNACIVVWKSNLEGELTVKHTVNFHPQDVHFAEKNPKPRSHTTGDHLKEWIVTTVQSLAFGG